MKYVMLASNEVLADGDDDSQFVRAILVEAESEDDATDKAETIAKSIGLEIIACHDGSACYQVVEELPRMNVSKLRKILNYTRFGKPAYILAVENQDVALKIDHFFSFKSFAQQVKKQLGLILPEQMSEETWAGVRKQLYVSHEDIEATPEIKRFIKERVA